MLYIAQHVCTAWRTAGALSTQVTLQLTVHQAAKQALPSAACLCSETYGKSIKHTNDTPDVNQAAKCNMSPSSPNIAQSMMPMPDLRPHNTFEAKVVPTA